VGRAPQLRGEGAESIVLDVSLRGAGDWSERPLVVRMLRTEDPSQLHRESAIQGALTEVGFPVPRPVTWGPGQPGVLPPFLVMERVPGRGLFSLLPAVILAGIVLQVLSVGALGLVIGLGWYAVAVRALLRLHALPVVAIERGLTSRGFDPSELRIEAWLERLTDQTKRLGLRQFESGLAWLRVNTPSGKGEVVCHGDYWAGNLIVSLRGVTSVIDWPNVAIPPREFDLGWNRVQDAGGLPVAYRLPEPWRGWLRRLLHGVVWATLLPHRWLYRVFGSLDHQTLDYYTAFHCLRILIWSYEHVGPTDTATPWSQGSVRAIVAARFARISGVEIEVRD